MSLKAVIDMSNSNALVSMAIVSENANNPYNAFCEYIKYCIFSSSQNSVQIKEIIIQVGKEFGVNLPYNITAQCLMILEKDGFVSQKNHLIKRIGTYNKEQFNEERNKYREKENSLIRSLKEFALKYDRDWTYEVTRELLISVLDRNNLAYDVFVNGTLSNKNIDVDVSDEINSDETNNEENNNGNNQPLYSDEFFVGKFIVKTLESDCIEKEYLLQVCEGLMLCAGVYQLPNADSKSSVSNIKGTEFFFDTRLLLRYIGCAGQAAKEAIKELVDMIQSLGGIICYYPQTLLEMEHALDEAAKEIRTSNVPNDNEMRLYAITLANAEKTLKAKKANLKDELAASNIHLRDHENFSETERIQYSFEKDDMMNYMRSCLRWDSQVLQNDIDSIWETHMRRHGDYSDYCGNKNRLPVFVTHNSLLLKVTSEYKNTREHIKGISGWKTNRLPIITDIKLSCRLWNISSNMDRMSLLYLTSNAVAAQRPTRKYINKIKELSAEFAENVPEYSAIPLSSYFEDALTDYLLEKISGNEINLNLGNFASSIEEISTLKAKEEEKKTKEVQKQLDEKSEKFNKQSELIIKDAVQQYGNHPAFILQLKTLIGFEWLIGIITTIISGVLSVIIKNPIALITIALPVIIFLADKFFTSNYIKKLLFRTFEPKIEDSLKKHVDKKIKDSERIYKDEIVQRIFDGNENLQKIKQILTDN